LVKKIVNLRSDQLIVCASFNTSATTFLLHHMLRYRFCYRKSWRI